MTFNVTRGHCW